MNALTPVRYLTPEDPSELGWPAAFPVEIALRVAPIKDICAAHNIDKARWDILRQDEGFVSVLDGYVKMLRQHGMSFKLKAMIQSEELLKTSFEIIHSPVTPAAVKADLIKNTIRIAGLDASIDQKAVANGGAGPGQNNFQININLT